MASLHTIRKKGLLDLPGITNATKSLTEKLLLSDAEKHHCYFRPAGLHNHLSHQCVAFFHITRDPYSDPIMHTWVLFYSYWYAGVIQGSGKLRYGRCARIDSKDI